MFFSFAHIIHQVPGQPKRFTSFNDPNISTPENPIRMEVAGFPFFVLRRKQGRPGMERPIKVYYITALILDVLFVQQATIVSGVLRRSSTVRITAGDLASVKLGTGIDDQAIAEAFEISRKIDAVTGKLSIAGSEITIIPLFPDTAGGHLKHLVAYVSFFNLAGGIVIIIVIGIFRFFLVLIIFIVIIVTAFIFVW